MPMYSNQRDLYEQGVSPQQSQMSVTIGTVVDTNDPQQMGRVRVMCPQWGDNWDSDIDDLPWAIYLSPFAGQTQVGTRGPGIQESEGGISYGAWWIPKVGAQAAIICVDGNTMTRMYIGCIYDQLTTHTLPNGRYMYDDHPELEKNGNDPIPYGPYTSTEKFIQPLSDNQHQAFGNKGDPNFEWQTRAADYTASRINVDQLDQTYSKVQDDKDVTVRDWVSTQGYQRSRTDPDGTSTITDKNYDNMIYSLTSPGFHSLTMDDRQENCRVRIRTTSGAQFLIDDTNERIYMSTAKGNNWVEMDQDGNIDVHSSVNVSIHASKNVNITADETLRLFAKKGIHMHSDEEVRIEALNDIHVKTAQNIRTHAAQSAYHQADADYHIKSLGSTYINSTGTLNLKTTASMYIEASVQAHVKAGSTLHLQADASMNLVSSTSILQTAPIIHLNGPAAASANQAVAATAPNEQPAFWTSRVPAHEPWARTATKDDFTHDPEFQYEDTNVNRSERGRTIDRGFYWRR